MAPADLYLLFFIFVRWFFIFLAILGDHGLLFSYEKHAYYVCLSVDWDCFQDDRIKCLFLWVKQNNITRQICEYKHRLTITIWFFYFSLFFFLRLTRTLLCFDVCFDVVRLITAWRTLAPHIKPIVRCPQKASFWWDRF